METPDPILCDTLHKKTCLNGWWDIIPVTTPYNPQEVPETGYLVGKYLVPSVITKSRHGVRKKGQIHYAFHNDISEEGLEFVFDNFDYPYEWKDLRAAWVRRDFFINKLSEGKRYYIQIDAVMPTAKVFVNGRKAGEHIHPTLPMEVDVTEYLLQGRNEIAVYIQEYNTDELGRRNVPTGNMYIEEMKGIWQDVTLIEKSEVTLIDITIRTSIKENRINIMGEVHNFSQRIRNVQISTCIVNWRKNDSNSADEKVLSFETRVLTLSPNESSEFEIQSIWKDAKYWYPEAPVLYQARVEICEEDVILETNLERFGFREVWIDGGRLMLNGFSLHFFSDWGHKASSAWCTREWVCKWVKMLKDANMNHSRLHANPHPPMYLEIADEEGILITGETGIFGCGNKQNSDSAEYWKNAEDHIRRFVKRDKNHPSLILWSVENEIRWGVNKTKLFQTEIPKLRKLFNRLDPTRPAYHDGDSSLWNENQQDIISRHYGKECGGIGWWDGNKPLLASEMGVHHFQTPNTAMCIGGDEVWTDYSLIDEASSMDALLITETARSLGVTGIAPWNISCIENLRMESEVVRLRHEDYTTYGMKLLLVQPHSSEFSFWKEGKGYTPNRSFEIMSRAFRPFAVIDRSLNSAYFKGTAFQREIFVVNDLPKEQEGKLAITLSLSGENVFKKEIELSIGRGEIQYHIIHYEIPAGILAEDYEYEVSFICKGTILDSWNRRIAFADRQSTGNTIPLVQDRMAVYGKGWMRSTLEGLALNFYYTDSLEMDVLDSVKILIMEKNTVIPGSNQNQKVKAFVEAGGRLILMEQDHSLFPEVDMEQMEVLTSFIRAPHHETVLEMKDEDFWYWGEDSYTLIASNSHVAGKLYRKDDGIKMLCILDSGEGAFGKGNLNQTSLFEAKEGNGLILACQMRISDKIKEIPSAEQLFINLLKRAASYRASEEVKVICADSILLEDLAFYIDKAEKGWNIIVSGTDAKGLEIWGKALKIPLRQKDVSEVYHVIRTRKDPMLDGISNEDLSGLEKFHYASKECENFSVGDCFIEPVHRLESLIETPVKSCLRELSAYRGQTELLRAHTVSRFMFAEKPEAAVALGYVEVGSGRIIFNQYMPPEGKRVRFARLKNRLLANMGITIGRRLLEGPIVPEHQSTGKGYPDKIYITNQSIDEYVFKQVIECTIPKVDHYSGNTVGKPILTLGEWEELSNEEGCFAATGLDLKKDIYVYYCIKSPMQRKDFSSSDGFPDPEILTFVDVTGEGEVVFIINGVQYEKLQVRGEATLSDVPLEKGINHILFKWTPGSQASTMKTCWRNIMRKVERGLSFF